MDIGAISKSFCFSCIDDFVGGILGYQGFVGVSLVDGEALKSH